MAAITLSGVSVTFPLYDAGSRSWKRRMLNASSGGRMVPRSRDKVMVPALSEVNLSLARGNRVAVLGGNGAGKTTLVRVLAGLLVPTAGRVAIEGTPFPILHLGFGYDPDATARETVELYGRLHGRKSGEIEALAEALASDDRAAYAPDTPIGALTPGETLRFAAAMGLTAGADILLFDEVLGTLGQADIERLGARCRERAAQGGVIVVVERSRALLRAFCDTAFLLDGGRLVQMGPIDQILDGEGSPYTY